MARASEVKPPVIPPRPAPALRFDITCPRCGHDVELVAPGIPGLKMTQAVVRCTRNAECARNPWLVRVTLECVNQGPLHRGNLRTEAVA